MNQFEFRVTNKLTGAKDRVRATTYNELEAYKAICEYYSDYEVETTAINVRPPHAVLGEIDCS